MEDIDDAMDDLIAELRDGVTPLGLGDDNCTELFDVNGADEKMAEAADALATTRAEAAALQERVAVLEGAGRGAAVSLLAALSILESAHKKGCEPKMIAASDKMFEQMLADYRKRLEAFRTTLAGPSQ